MTSQAHRYAALFSFLADIWDQVDAEMKTVDDLPGAMGILIDLKGRIEVLAVVVKSLREMAEH